MKKRMLSIGECMAELRGGISENYAMGYAGDCFNTAYYFKAASGPNWVTEFYSAVGDDALSAKMTAFMTKTGIETRHVHPLAGMSVGLYMIELKNGERSFHYWRSMSAARKMISHYTLATALSTANLIYLSGITLAIIDEPARVILMAELDKARDAGKTIAFDPNIRAKLWGDPAVMQFWIRQTALRSTIVLPSFDDESLAFSDATPQATADRYRGYDVQHVVVKNGGHPIWVLNDGKLTQFEIVKPTSVVDTTSAGDAFNGAYLAHFMDTGSVAEAIGYAAKMAASVIAEHGAIIPTEKLSIDRHEIVT